VRRAEEFLETPICLQFTSLIHHPNSPLLSKPTSICPLLPLLQLCGVSLLRKFHSFLRSVLSSPSSPFEIHNPSHRMTPLTVIPKRLQSETHGEPLDFPSAFHPRLALHFQQPILMSVKETFLFCSPFFSLTNHCL